MKKTLFVFVMAAGMMGFASCDSATENRAEEQTEKMEDAADETDKPAMEEQAEETEDSVDTIDPQ